MHLSSHGRMGIHQPKTTKHQYASNLFPGPDFCTDFLLFYHNFPLLKKVFAAPHRFLAEHKLQLMSAAITVDSSVTGSAVKILFPSAFTNLAHLYWWTLTGDMMLPWAFYGSCTCPPDSPVHGWLQKDLRVDLRLFFIVYIISFWIMSHYFPSGRVPLPGQLVTSFNWVLHGSFFIISSFWVKWSESCLSLAQQPHRKCNYIQILLSDSMSMGFL